MVALFPLPILGANSGFGSTTINAGAPYIYGGFADNETIYLNDGTHQWHWRNLWQHPTWQLN